MNSHTSAMELQKAGNRLGRGENLNPATGTRQELQAQTSKRHDLSWQQARHEEAWPYHQSCHHLMRNGEMLPRQFQININPEIFSARERRFLRGAFSDLSS